MGDKIVGRYEFGFENPSPGLHLMEAKKVDVVKNADAAKGWTYKVESVVIGGDAAGRPAAGTRRGRPPVTAVGVASPCAPDDECDRTAHDGGLGRASALALAT